MKLIFLAFLMGITYLLSACGTASVTPIRMSDTVFSDVGQSAYVWTSGWTQQPKFINLFWSLRDYATITRIDDVNVPDSFLPSERNEPLFAWLLEIPAGSHNVEIVYKEELPPICCLKIERSRQTIAVIVKPKRTYAPFVSDKCSRNWFWLEDWGPYVAGSETKRFVEGMESDLTRQVVAGEAPPKGSCEQFK